MERESSPMQEFETIRHGDKAGEKLSELGIEQAREKAHEWYERIKEAELGTVVYILPSNVGRAQETRNTVEAELRELCRGDSDIEFISVQNAERIAEVKDDFSRKYVVTDMVPTTALGFNERTPSIPAFLNYKKGYNNNENLIGKTWAAREDELDDLKQEVASVVPDFDRDKVRPQDFVETPEEAALHYLRLTKRMTELCNKYFPGHTVKGIHVGHNLSADFAAMAMLGKPISLQTIRELGDEFRRFVESSSWKSEAGKTIVQYRDHEVEQEHDLDQIVTRLQDQSSLRHAWWKALDEEPAG